MNKKEVLQQGISVIDSTSFISEQKNEKLEQLKKLIPEIVNADGQLNTQALHDCIDIANTTSNNKGYELTFAGKGIARAMADTETTKELKVEKEQSKDFENTEHVVIRGDNLEVLKILKQNYYEKIKMIYIDPPYNTTSENFIYNDNFKQSEEELVKNLGLDENTTDFLHNVYGTRSHSGWLAFMYPRLKLARQLLREDGVIFISIDDNEQANLKILCDEIFGDENVDSFVWRKSGEGRDGKMKNTQTIRKDHEYILFAFKNESKLNKSLEKPNWVNDYSNPDNDPRGNFKAGSISKKEEASNKNSTNFYTVTSPSGRVFERQFDIPKEEFEKLDKNNRIYWGKNQDAVPAIKIFENEKRETNTSSLILNNGTTTSGTDYLNDILEKKDIGTTIRPKPCELLNKIIQISTTENDIILDFFAGSGTTGDAVMQLNAEDGGNRKYIVVQWDETIKENTETHTFCTENKFPPVISSICIERLNRAGEKIKQEQKVKDEKLDIGYKVFSLTEKQKIIETKENNQTLFQLANKRTSTENTLYNMLCATCKSLDTKIQEIIKDKLYQADNELYLLSTITSEELEPYKDHKINIDGYSDISLEQWLNLGVGDKENISVVY